MQLYRVRWCNAERRILYVQLSRECTVKDVIAACHEWRELSDSVDHEVRAIIDVSHCLQGRGMVNIAQYAPIRSIIPPGSHEIAIVGADNGTFQLISSLLRVIFPQAMNRVHFFDTIARAEAFLKRQANT